MAWEAAPALTQSKLPHVPRGKPFLSEEKIILLLPKYSKNRLTGKADFQARGLSHGGKRAHATNGHSGQHLAPFKEEDKCISVPVTIFPGWAQSVHEQKGARGGWGEPLWGLPLHILLLPVPHKHVRTLPERRGLLCVCFVCRNASKALKAVDLLQEVVIFNVLKVKSFINC